MQCVWENVYSSCTFKESYENSHTREKLLVQYMKTKICSQVQSPCSLEKAYIRQITYIQIVPPLITKQISNFMCYNTST